MTPQQWAEIKHIIGECEGYPVESRRGFVEKAARGDKYLYEACLDLLDLPGELDGFLEVPPVSEDPGFVLQALSGAFLGQTIGAYRITRKLGEGGMGIVFEAVRADGLFDQRVSLKILKFSGYSNEFLKTFHRERQILARLKHPNIARLIDAGTTETGLPYFVMEYIDGVALSTHCEQANLKLESRLELLGKVCGAVSYAHGHLVVHRDIKPSNILVDGEGEPKLLDFGIAKLLTSAESGEQTMTALHFGTPEYASPEQILGMPVSIATDVYALGVIAYELVTGVRPVQVSTPSGVQVQRVVTEDPAAPGLQLARGKLSGGVKSGPAAMGKIGRDLDDVILKALEKDPGRRYASASDFGADIHRYLCGAPVSAHRQTRLYRMSKFIGRHPQPVITATLLVLGLCVTSAVSFHQAQIARRRLQQGHSLANSLIFELYEAVRDLPGAIKARDVVVKRALTYLNAASEDTSEPSLLADTASAYMRIGAVQHDANDASRGEISQARASYQKAVNLLEQVTRRAPGNEDYTHRLVICYLRMEELYSGTPDKAKAQQYVDRALHLSESRLRQNQGSLTLKADVGRSTFAKASFLSTQGRLDDAATAWKRCLQMFTEVAAAKPDNRESQRNVALADKHLAANCSVRKDYINATKYYLAALAIETKLLAASPQSPSAMLDLSYSHSDLGLIAAIQNDLDGALGHYNESLRLRTRIVEDDADNWRARHGIAILKRRIANILSNQGKLESALESASASLDIEKKLKPEVRDTMAVSSETLGDMFDIANYQEKLAKQQKSASRRSMYYKAAITGYRDALAKLEEIASKHIQHPAENVKESLLRERINRVHAVLNDQSGGT